MSICSKKCNEICDKVQSISGLSDDYVYEQLEKLFIYTNTIVNDIEKYAHEDILNGTCFKKKIQEKNTRIIKQYTRAEISRMSTERYKKERR